MYTDIEDYAIIGNLKSAGLVSKSGSIDWLPAPYISSGSVFAKMDVDMTANRYPDFWEYRDKMKLLSREYPNWNAEKLYKTVKRECEIEEEEKKKEDKLRAEKELNIQTEREGVTPHITQKKKLSEEDALDLAFRKAFPNQS